MQDVQKLAKFEEFLDVEPESLQPQTQLSDIEEWDSVNKLSFIIMMDEDFGKTITGDDIRQLNTVGDILKLMQAE